MHVCVKICKLIYKYVTYMYLVTADEVVYGHPFKASTMCIICAYFDQSITYGKHLPIYFGSRE